MIIFYRILSESPNIRKISLMLQEIDLPYTVKLVEAHNAEASDSDFLKINPNNTVPAIMDTDTGVGLFESGAILYYLAEKTGKLLPTNFYKRAEAIKWLMFEVANVCPAIIELHHYIMTDTGDIPDTVFQRYKNKLAGYCAILDNQLTERQYLAGEYSIADIAIYPWVVTLEDMAEIDIKDYSNLKSWAERISNQTSI